MGDRLEKQWRIEENDRTKPSICHALWICFGKIYLSIGAILFAMKITMTVWSPEAQSKLISYFSPNQTKLTKNDAIFYACVVIGLKVGIILGYPPHRPLFF
jgi:ATP-binding cassette subfamily C (CFTR/MRP) protein 4